MERVLVIRDNITLVIQGPMNTHMGSLRRGILNIPYYSKFVKNIVVSSWKQNSKDVKMSKRFMREHSVKHVDDEEKNYEGHLNQGNVSLQVATTLNGLKLVETEYVIKVRCDEYYENLDKVIETLENNPDQLITSEPFYRTNQIDRYAISDHVMAAQTVKMRDMLEKAQYFCKNACDEIRETDMAPEEIMRQFFDGQNTRVSMEHFGKFFFKISGRTLTQKNYAEYRKQHNKVVKSLAEV